ncbi:MAG: GNAT family N-acetyltransferase [Deltaproteobacteria bacterium]
MELGVFEAPGQEWDEFVSQYSDLIFYQSFWSEVLKRGLGGHPLYFYLREGGRIVAGLPAVLFNFKIFRILYASIPYGGLIGDRSAFPPFSSLLDTEFRKRRFDQVRVADSPFSDPYSPVGFSSVSAKCSLLDLRGFDKENILENYRSEVRRAIRKAQKSGLSVTRAVSREEARIFNELYASSMERNRAGAKYPGQWFYTLFDMMVEQGRADIFFARKDDHYAAGVVVIHSSSTDHYLHNGSENAFLEYRPNDLIVDHIIQDGLGKGKIFLDFMGSDPKDVSLLRFKEKWGSRSLDIRTHIKNVHPLKAKLWEWGKKVMSSEWGSKWVRVIRG